VLYVKIKTIWNFIVRQVKTDLFGGVKIVFLQITYEETDYSSADMLQLS